MLARRSLSKKIILKERDAKTVLRTLSLHQKIQDIKQLKLTPQTVQFYFSLIKNQKDRMHGSKNF